MSPTLDLDPILADLLDRHPFPPLEPGKQVYSPTLKTRIQALDTKPVIKAALNLANDDIKGCHDIVEKTQGEPTADVLHAILHRREGECHSRAIVATQYLIKRRRYSRGLLEFELVSPPFPKPHLSARPIVYAARTRPGGGPVSNTPYSPPPAHVNHSSTPAKNQLQGPKKTRNCENNNGRS